MFIKHISFVLIVSFLGVNFPIESNAQTSNNFAIVDSGATTEEIVKKAATITPSQHQYEWQKLEFTAFVHFGMNTFTGREWGDGTEDPVLFNPTDFDASQWMQAFKEVGIKLVILTAKHHDGFCLWPSKYTEHDVTNSPWRNGNGDVVKEVAQAADRAGLKFGVYLSPWDRHESSYGDSDAYNQFFKNQLRELLTSYGKIDEVWFDGAKREGVNQEYDWDGYYRLIRTLQPEAVIAVRGPDVRWVGTESGYGRETEWSVVPGGPIEDRQKAQQGLVMPNVDPVADDLGSRQKLAGARSLFWYPSEVDVSIRPGWFYHEEEDQQVKSLSKMLDIYYSSVGRNSLLLLNVPPDKRGRIHEEDVKRLRGLRQVLDQTFSENLAAASNIGPESTGESRNLFDNNIETHWSPAAGRRTGSVILDLRTEQTFNRLMLQENILVGQRVEQFRVEAVLDGKWKQIAEGTTIGYKRLLRFTPITTDKVRLHVERSRLNPAIGEFGLYKAPELLTAPAVTRNKQGYVRISTESPDPVVFYTLDGSTPTPGSHKYEEPFALPDGGTVKARAYINGLQKSSDVITETFDIAKTSWTIEAASESAGGFSAEQAIDGDPSTMWHTLWQKRSPTYPHELVIDLGTLHNLRGFTYTPRQDGNISGTAYRYELYVSEGGRQWAKADQGEFSNIRNNPMFQRVKFEKPIRGRYIKFRGGTSGD